MRGVGAQGFHVDGSLLAISLHFLSSSEKLLCGCGCREDMVCSSCQPHVVLHTAGTVSTRAAGSPSWVL